LLVLLGAALAVAAVRGLDGIGELALYSAPLCLMVALLVSDRFVGEEWIAARTCPARVPRPRRRSQRWARRHEPARVSLLERRADRLRGPPLFARA
jgi:hypothetical protein